MLEIELTCGDSEDGGQDQKCGGGGGGNQRVRKGHENSPHDHLLISMMAFTRVKQRYGPPSTKHLFQCV